MLLAAVLAALPATLPAASSASLPRPPGPADTAVPARGTDGAPPAGHLVGAQGRAPGPVAFADATAGSGLDFTHVHGGHGERYMVETMGSGVALVDLDGDGRLDAYLVQGAPTPGGDPGAAATDPGAGALRNALFRGRGDGTFERVAAGHGADDGGYGMGVAAADYDDDGWVDLYVTNFGADRLFRNNGDGTFSDVTAAAGLGDDLWGASAAWGDIEGDGDLDLYVTRYVDFAWDHHVFCGNRRQDVRAYCHPDVYQGVADLLYRNRGDGTFEEIGAAAGVANATEGKGLGVVFADLDDDGDADVYVANDSERNFLYLNEGDGTFHDDALLAGVGYSEDGKAEAGMGTDAADFDGDGRLDLVVTNLDLETNTLYRNVGAAAFTDVSFGSGVGEPSLLTVGFGTNWLDHDHDGDVDLFVANGHIIDNIELFKDNVTWPQPNHLYRNDGGRFVEIHAEAGPGLALVKVSRGSATGDVDRDGDPDIVVTNNGEAADLLRNDGGSAAGNWLQLRLVGTSAARTAAGARVTVTPQRDDGGRGSAGPLPADGAAIASRGDGAGEVPGPRVVEVRAGSSYLSTSDPTLHVGLGAATAAAVTVRWPGGDVEDLGVLEAGRRRVVRQGTGVVASRSGG